MAAAAPATSREAAAGSTSLARRIPPPLDDALPPDDRPGSVDDDESAAESDGGGDDGGEAMYDRLRSAWAAGTAATRGARENGPDTLTSGIESVPAPPIRSKSSNARRAAAPVRPRTRSAAAVKSTRRAVHEQQRTCSRLHEDAHRIDRQRQSALRAKNDAEERQVRPFRMTNRGGRAQSADSRVRATTAGERLYKVGQQALEARDRAFVMAKTEADEAGAHSHEWLCPRCGGWNEAGANICATPVGRRTSLMDARQNCWVHIDLEARLNEPKFRDDDVVRCGQPRPAPFQPSIVSAHSRAMIDGIDPSRADGGNPADNQNQEPVWDYLYRIATTDKEVREAIPNPSDAELTFQPRIDEHSRALIRERERQLERARNLAPKDELNDAESSASADTSASRQPVANRCEQLFLDAHVMRQKRLARKEEEFKVRRRSRRLSCRRVAEGAVRGRRGGGWGASSILGSIANTPG
jgi:hypothetical protein